MNRDAFSNLGHLSGNKKAADLSQDILYVVQERFFTPLKLSAWIFWRFYIFYFSNLKTENEAVRGWLNIEVAWI